MHDQRIRWTMDEKLALAHNVAKKQLQLGYHGLNLQIIHDCQTVLPKNRRRRFRAMTKLCWLKDMVEAQRALILSTDKKDVADNPMDVVKKEATTTNGGDNQVIHILKHMLGEVSRSNNLLTNICKVLTKDSSSAANDLKEANRILPNVLVIGAMEKQKNQFQDDFKDMLNIDATQDINEIKGKSSWADNVLLWTTFMSHKHQDVARNCAAEKCWYVSGGMSSVKAALEEVFMNYEKENSAQSTGSTA